jgi:hypothetical protein
LAACVPPTCTCALNSFLIVTQDSFLSWKVWGPKFEVGNNVD